MKHHLALLLAALTLLTTLTACDTSAPAETTASTAASLTLDTASTTATEATTAAASVTTTTAVTTSETTMTDATTATEPAATYPELATGDDEKACYDAAVEFLNRTAKLEWAAIPCDLTEFFYPTEDAMEAKALKNFAILAEVAGQYRAGIGSKHEYIPIGYSVSACETDGDGIVMTLHPTGDSPIPGVDCAIRFAKHGDRWLIRAVEPLYGWNEYDTKKYEEIDGDALLEFYLNAYENSVKSAEYLRYRDLEHWSGSLSPTIDFSVRGQLGIWEGELTAEQIASVTSLSLRFLTYDDLDDWEHALDGLELCTGVQKLSMENYLGESLEFLRLFPDLRMLSLRKPGYPTDTVYDLSPLADLTGLTRLELSNYRAGDLSPVGELTELRELWIEKSGNVNLGALSKLTDLRVLTLRPGEGDTVTGIPTLENMGNLTCLRIEHGVGDFSALAELPLIGLSLTECTVDSYARLPRTLETLFALESGYADTDIPDLAKLPKLEYLFVDVCEDETALLDLGLTGCIAPGVGTLFDRYEYPGPYNMTLLLEQMDWTSDVPGVEAEQEER